jgi:DNA-binding NtrC family response regulator
MVSQTQYSPCAQRDSVRERLETILLADDEDSVRDMLHMVLQRAGFEVLKARTGSEAWRVCREHPGPIHLLLADALVVPMGCRHLIEDLSRRRPTARVLCISGYPRETLLDEGLIDPDMHFLQKPFTPAELTRKIREVLER